VAFQVTVGLLLAAYVASTILRTRGSTSVLFDDWVGNLAYSGAAVLCGWRALAERQDRWAWGFLARSRLHSSLWALCCGPPPFNSGSPFPPSLTDAFSCD
jgi:hypothetical protein